MTEKTVLTRRASCVEDRRLCIEWHCLEPAVVLVNALCGMGLCLVSDHEPLSDSHASACRSLVTRYLPAISTPHPYDFYLPLHVCLFSAFRTLSFIPSFAEIGVNRGKLAKPKSVRVPCRARNIVPPQSSIPVPSSTSPPRPPPSCFVYIHYSNAWKCNIFLHLSLNYEPLACRVDCALVSTRPPRFPASSKVWTRRPAPHRGTSR